RTKLSYVRAHRGSDVGIELWGGSAQASHIVVSGVQDDSIDWGPGFQGRPQRVVLQHHSHAAAITDADNRAAHHAATPRSMPTVYNATLVGGGGNGVVLRVGTWGTINNAIITGAPYAIDVRDGSTAAGTENDPPSLNVANSIFFDNGEDGTTHFTAA